MNAKELSDTLSRMYHGAGRGDQVVMIHLFGVRYAEAVRACGASAKDIVKGAGIADT